MANQNDSPPWRLHPTGPLPTKPRWHGFISIRRVLPDGELSRLSDCIPVPDDYSSRIDLQAAAEAEVKRLFAGQVSRQRVEEKRTVKDYEVIGSAAFRADEEKWEPLLEIRKKKPPNKGAKQILADVPNPLTRNLFDTPERAAWFGADYGERMVNGYVGGLKI